MNEPLKHFFSIYNFDKSQIKKVARGEKYIAVMLENGQIGVCATLKNKLAFDMDKSYTLNLDRIDHRIFYNAYLNALLKYDNEFAEDKDIFNRIDFNNYSNLVMVGFFKPLVEKLRKNGINLSVFDLYSNDDNILQLKHQDEYVRKADGLILTATSIFNGTFTDIVNATDGFCDVFILGPSSILHKDIMQYKSIKTIFGTIFRKHDRQVLDIISEGYGTRYFQPLGKKVYL